jgi:hypothetical protein
VSGWFLLATKLLQVSIYALLPLATIQHIQVTLRSHLWHTCKYEDIGNQTDFNEVLVCSSLGQRD